MHNEEDHLNDCSWHNDWHTCNCGTFDIPNPCKEIEVGIHTMPRKCLLVIHDTFIMCGEMGQYCSTVCLQKAKDKL